MNERHDPRGSFLTRLARDVRANTLIIVAFALIPLCGMIGGGLDLSRMYIVKTRLQHACDAGALAGRKSMGGGTWAQQSGMPGKQALRFFDSNITTNAFGSENTQREFKESAGKVTGTASADVPMTLMRVLGQTTQSLTVTCEAEMRLPNTDVMFVLDVTGSMASKANSSDSLTRIQGLRVAVKCFYEIVARLDTNVNCDGGAPSGGTGNQVQIRFGFVPYASNANVGQLLPTANLVDSATYNTRRFAGWGNWSNESQPTTRPAVNGSCGWIDDKSTESTQYRGERYGNSFSGFYCREYMKTRSAKWDYGSYSLDVSALKKGASDWNDSFTAPIGKDKSNLTVNWSGCVEERPTAWTLNNLGLDIDRLPSISDDTTRWRPSLPDATFMRATSNGRATDLNTAEVKGTTDNYQTYENNIAASNGTGRLSLACPTRATLLEEWPNAAAFDAYVDSLTTAGNTYHDIGMMWGARLMSPTGMFRERNAFTKDGGEIERHMIFMTDGDATSWPCDYNAFGIHLFDKRLTTDVGPANDCLKQRTSLSNQINARMLAICAAVRANNITLWVVSFGDDTNDETETRLETCASEGRYFKANDSTALQKTFRSIADQISALRLVK